MDISQVYTRDIFLPASSPDIVNSILMVLFSRYFLANILLSHEEKQLEGMAPTGAGQDDLEMDDVRVTHPDPLMHEEDI